MQTVNRDRTGTSEQQDRTATAQFNEPAQLVIYAENAAGYAAAQDVRRTLAAQGASVVVRRGAAPVPPGSWGC